MRSPLLRLAPATLVAGLLIAVVFPSAARAERAPRAPAGAQAVGCAAGALNGTDAVFGITANTGVRQPFDLPVAAATCTLGLDYAWSYAQAQVQVWDPLALAPDGRYVALRSRAYDTSRMSFNHLRMDFSPPLVTAAVAHVAQPVPSFLAFDFQVTSVSTQQNVHYWSNGPVGMPAAFSYTTTGSTPLPGLHPVLALGVCPPEGADADLRVVQAVMTTTTMPGLWYHDYAQKFRVPQRCELRSVEFPLGVNYMGNVPLGHVAVIDAANLPEPPAAIPPSALAEADFLHYHTLAGWETHSPFATNPVLEPDHDYWLWVYTGFGYNIGLTYRTGGESVDFQNAIGATYTRPGPYQAWAPWSGYAMNFRLIGVPLAPAVSVPPAGSARGLRLTVEPNPATRLARVRWAGANGGGARFEVLDPRGRRVARFDGTGDAGAWAWNGAAEGGGPLPAGVYFVRAVDRDGAVATARVVMLR